MLKRALRWLIFPCDLCGRRDREVRCFGPYLNEGNIWLCPSCVPRLQGEGRQT